MLLAHCRAESCWDRVRTSTLTVVFTYVLLALSTAVVEAQVPAANLNSSTTPTLAPGPTIAPATAVATRPEAKIADTLAPWALLMSILSIVITIANLAYGWNKDKRARAASIDDDFWFRKVVTPSAIEPTIQGVRELLTTLPTEEDPVDVRRDYARAVTTKFVALQGNIALLSLLDEKLPELISGTLSDCEDLLTNYAGQLVENEPQNELTMARTKVQTDAWGFVKLSLQTIREAHRKRHQ
jgi:hypothetical protein